MSTRCINIERMYVFNFNWTQTRVKGLGKLNRTKVRRFIRFLLDGILELNYIARPRDSFRKMWQDWSSRLTEDNEFPTASPDGWRIQRREDTEKEDKGKRKGLFFNLAHEPGTGNVAKNWQWAKRRYEWRKEPRTGKGSGTSTRCS